MGWAKRKVISGLAILEQIIVTDDSVTIKKVAILKSLNFL